MSELTRSPDEVGLDPDAVIANLSDRIGRDARTIAMLQAALVVKDRECDELRGALVKATGGGTGPAGDAGSGGR